MIDCMNWLGACESYSSIYNMRTKLAAIEELMVKKQAAWGICQIIFDNMDLHIKQLHHLTLPVLIFEMYPTFHLPNDDEKSWFQTLNLFTNEILDLNAPRNLEEKNHFLFVVKTVLANEICREVPQLKWISNWFEKHHPHKHSNTASSRSHIHVEPPKPLDEKKTSDMTSLLDDFVDRYLNLMAERLPDDTKERFCEAKKQVKSMECSEQDLRKAEKVLLETAKEFGFLIVHGDLLRLVAF